MGVFAPLFPILALVGYIIILIINYGATAGQWFSDLNVGEVSDVYNITLTPAGWTFGIWGIIYTWQPLWIIYVIILSCKSINRGKLYFNKLFWISYFASCIFNCLWIAVWVMEEITLAMICLILIWISLVICGYSAHYWLTYEIPFALSQGATEESLDKYPQSLILSFKRGSNNNCCRSEKDWLYVGVLNGIPIYATWTTIATCLNIGIFFKYEINTGNDTAVAISLSLLILNILIYWFFDFIKFNSMLRFTFTPYFVLIWAFLGVLTKYSYQVYDSSVVILILLIMAGIASIYKIYDSIKLIKKYDMNGNSGNLNGNNTASANGIVAV